MVKIISLIKNNFFAYLTLLLFIANSVFLSKAIEFRPDVPGLFFAMLSLFYLVKGIKLNNVKKLNMSYLYYGVAIIFTQKYLVLLPSLIVCHIFLFAFKSKRDLLIENLKCFCLLLTPFLLLYLVFCLLNAGDEFIEQNIMTNFKWKKVGSHIYHTSAFFRGMKFELLFCGLGLCAELFRSIKGRSINKFSVLFGINIFWFYIFIITSPCLSFTVLFNPYSINSILCDVLFRGV